MHNPRPGFAIPKVDPTPPNSTGREYAPKQVRGPYVFFKGELNNEPEITVYSCSGGCVGSCGSAGGLGPDRKHSGRHNGDNTAGGQHDRHRNDGQSGSNHIRDSTEYGRSYGRSSDHASDSGCQRIGPELDGNSNHHNWYDEHDWNQHDSNDEQRILHRCDYGNDGQQSGGECRRKRDGICALHRRNVRMLAGWQCGNYDRDNTYGGRG